jgi:hypothetical protein
MTKPHSPITFDPPARGEYGIQITIRHREWRKMTPDQRATVLRAGADVLDACADQMRVEARQILEVA